jgi:hypothetical protein
MSENRNPEISKLNINGTVYNVKDTDARAAAQEALAEHNKLLNKETEQPQTINGQVEFKQAFVLANGATIIDEGTKVTFR